MGKKAKIVAGLVAVGAAIAVALPMVPGYWLASDDQVKRAVRAIHGHTAALRKAIGGELLYAKSCVLIGSPGAGQLTKMVNQIVIGGLMQGLAEGLNFGQRAGLDMEKVVSVISKGAAQSWQMENRWKPMTEGKFDGFGFAVDWMRKDLGICLAEAKHNGARLPVTALVDQFYAQVQARGGKRWDTCSLMQLLIKD